MRTYTILLADDEAHITHIVAMKLRGAGFSVMTARDGEEAYELVCEHKPDLVITDLQMPYMSGLDLCLGMRDNPETADIPAIMLTARGYVLDPVQVEKAGITRIMSKPFSAREVLQAVRDVLSPAERDREAA